MECSIHDAELEQVYPEDTELTMCEDCAAELSGQSVEMVRLYEAARQYRGDN